MANETNFIERFEAFARSKPADERYDFGNIDQCACGQFHAFLGQAAPKRSWIEEELGEYAYDGDHTFGALADRLAKLRADQS